MSSEHKKSQEELALDRKKFIARVVENPPGSIGTLGLFTMDKKCYLCGRTEEQFNAEFGIDIMRDEYSKALQKQKELLQRTVDAMSRQFIEAHRSEFESYYAFLQSIPDVLNKLSLSEIFQQKGTLAKLHPELNSLTDFRNNKGSIQPTPNTLGNLKTAYQKLMEDFSRNIVPHGAIGSVSQRYSINEKDPPEYIITLNKSMHKIKLIDEDTRFTYSFQNRSVGSSIPGRNHAGIGLNFHLCPICSQLTPQRA